MFNIVPPTMLCSQKIDQSKKRGRNIYYSLVRPEEATIDAGSHASPVDQSNIWHLF